MIDLTHERDLLSKGKTFFGIDEAGRGPWAGPVAVAGILCNTQTAFIEGINDSKQLTEKKREEQYEKIITTHPYHITLVPVETIDRVGVGNAVIQGMQEVLDTLNADLVFIDGYFRLGSFHQSVTCVPQGDALYYCIAAASILAKVTRDRNMIKLDKQYPEYGFAKHKGYGTKAHMEALKRYGVSPVHRRSYKPIQGFLALS